MDHETALRTSATERYFLGELTGQDRDGFEEHYFMCPECAEDVRALTVFAANAKAVFRQEAAGPAPQAGLLLSGRVLWLSAALNVALLLGVGYGLLKVRPAMRQELAEEQARGNATYAEVEGSVLMHGVDVGRHALVRGAIVDKNVRIPDGARIGVDLDLDRARFAVSAGGVVVIGKGEKVH